VTTYVALLRAVNLAGYQRVAMADLRALVDGLGLADVRTLLQSGNVVFRGRDRATGPLEALLEAEAKKRLALDTAFLVRTAREWRTIVSENPFPREAVSDPGHLLVMCLKSVPKPSAVTALGAALRGPEVLRARGRELYIVYPDGVGRSKLTGALIEKKLATRGTARNWNTVLKLAAEVDSARE
jgi:uncharacterized protein (DUF1697 family)